MSTPYGTAPVAGIATNPQPGYPANQFAAAPAPKAFDPVIFLAALGFVVLGIAALGVAAYMLSALGAIAAVIAFVMALLPLALVIAAILWIDRWEPEPRAALLFALLWGAAASIAIALLFSFVAQIATAIVGIGEGAGTVFLSAVVQAPIVEEVAKGTGILLLFWMFRRHFDGPVDGLVYGATIAVGFAFTENIQYFGLALTSSGLAGVSEIFFLRGVLSPFAHVMFTACIGIVLGFAARRTGPAGAIGFFLLGLVPAILLHAFWNGMAFVVSNFYLYYAVVQVPLFLLGIAFVMFLRREERKITAARLTDYSRAGWFSPGEVALLSSAAGRRQGRSWANRHGLGAAFAAYTRDATRLAFTRQRVITSRDTIAPQRAEAELLAELTRHRQALASLPPMPAAEVRPSY